MQKQIAKELKTEAQRVAERFSNPNRDANPTAETFEVNEIIPLSDDSALVYFKKTTDKIGMAFFYYIKRGASKGWKYFFPTDSHIQGMGAVQFYKLEIERNNFKHNF
jgi:hypothetical protein